MQQNGGRPWDYSVDVDTHVVTMPKKIKNDVHQVIKNRKPQHRKGLSFKKRGTWNYKSEILSYLKYSADAP